jgi:hypothetical protein
MLRALQHDRPGSGRGRGVCRRQTARAGADHGDIPLRSHEPKV